MFVEARFRVWQWVVVTFKRECYVGEVCFIEDDMIQVKCVKRIGGSSNNIAWPDEDDISWFTPTEIFCNIDPPLLVTPRVFVLFHWLYQFLTGDIDYKYFIKNMDRFYFVLF